MIDRDNALIVSDSRSVAMQDVKTKKARETISLPYRYLVSVRCLHPSLPLFFVDSGMRGCVDCVTQKMELRTLSLLNESIRLLMTRFLSPSLSMRTFTLYKGVETMKSLRLMCRSLRFLLVSTRWRVLLFLLRAM